MTSPILTWLEILSTGTQLLPAVGIFLCIVAGCSLVTNSGDVCLRDAEGLVLCNLTITARMHDAITCDKDMCTLCDICFAVKTDLI